MVHKEQVLANSEAFMSCVRAVAHSEVGSSGFMGNGPLIYISGDYMGEVV